MRQLPEKVLKEFKKGNFVVKGLASEFNQVSADQIQEWLNVTVKYNENSFGIMQVCSIV